MFAPTRPDKLALTLRALRRWGPSAAAGYSTSAIRYPDHVALIDELGSLTFVEMQRRTNALAHAWSDEGIGAGDVVAILCRNHRGFVEALVACSKLGAHALFLNTAFSAPPAAGGLRARAAHGDRLRRGVRRVVIAAAGAGTHVLRLAGVGPSRARRRTTLDALIERGDPSEVVAPADKGRDHHPHERHDRARRRAPTARTRRRSTPVAALLSKIPLRARERTLIAAPLFHSWGLAHLLIAIGLSSTVILRRRFDAEQTLRAIDEHGVTALVVVPVMLQRILERGPAVVRRYDSGSLRVIAASGSTLPGELATRVMDRSATCSTTSTARPRSPGRRSPRPPTCAPRRGPPGARRAGPLCACSTPRTATSRRGETGRIFVGNELVFDGYTGGGGKAVVDGLVSSGDLGRFDAAGRLFVEGREDEMIVSGGENVFPREVEDAIAALEG